MIIETATERVSNVQSADRRKGCDVCLFWLAECWSFGWERLCFVLECRLLSESYSSGLAWEANVSWLKSQEVLGTKDRNLSSCFNNPPDLFCIHLYIYVFCWYQKGFFDRGRQLSLKAVRGYVWSFFTAGVFPFLMDYFGHCVILHLFFRVKCNDCLFKVKQKLTFDTQCSGLMLVLNNKPEDGLRTGWQLQLNH